jgi:hypothetical protein
LLFLTLSLLFFKGMGRNAIGYVFGIFIVQLALAIVNLL